MESHNNSNLKLTYMQNESKGVYVQMPKQDHDEAVKLLDELVGAINFGLLTDRDVTVLEILNANLSSQAKEYLLNKFHSSLKVEEFTPSEATV